MASFVRGCKLGGGSAPGPLLALATLAGLAGTLSLARRHPTPAQRHAAQACLLMFTSAAAVLLISDAFEFSWRYQLPPSSPCPPPPPSPSPPCSPTGGPRITDNAAHTRPPGILSRSQENPMQPAQSGPDGPVDPQISRNRPGLGGPGDPDATPGGVLAARPLPDRTFHGRDPDTVAASTVCDVTPTKCQARTRLYRDGRLELEGFPVAEISDHLVD